MADVEPTLNRDHADYLRESVMSLMTNVNHQLQEIEKLKLEAETDETVSSEADMALLSPWSKLEKSTEAREESTTQPLAFSGTDPVSGKEQLRSDSDMSASSETEKSTKSSSLEQLQNLPDTAPENSAEANPTDSENPLERFALQFEDWIEKTKTKLESLMKQNRTTEEQSVKTSHFESYISCRLDIF
ncbi:PREDICTED: uncharacterized protein LOC109476361 [Branchiostoma belcheri]|uniref:Uncharacterized protein LOC109476361 n=1 Tax=Branchiostoma belcheri TaxID=7741 RepID=A0A6P4ZFW5_BRABE|nr:PREDICTED: uncharacterized protein LOC109476361 [Branchiostoma belcheri]